jgi:AraC-like DNA-binding protein
MDKPTIKFQVDLKTQKLADPGYKLEGIDSNTYKFHTHEGFEILQMWCDEGFIIIEDKVYPIVSGGIYLINALEIHSVNPAQDKPYIRNKVTFSSVYIRTILEQMNELHLLDPFTNTHPSFENYILPDENTKKSLNDLFFLLTNELDKKATSYSALTCCYLIEILVLIYRCFDKVSEISPNTLPPTQTHISNMIAYINSNVTSDIDIDKMSSDLHISKYYMCHLFKKITGYTIMEYLIEKRIALSKRLLLMSDKTISQISSEVGFSSFSLFSRTFKRATGISPKEFRG